MRRNLLLFTGSLLFSITAFASAPLDSIGVENSNGKKTIIHKVEPKESYYSISRKYKVSPQSVIDYNSNKPLPIGLVIKVPTDRVFTSERVVNVPLSTKKPQTDKTALVEYKVGARETLYSISRQFNTTVEAIQSDNNLSGTALATGQILKIRYGTQTAGITPPAQISLSRSIMNGTLSDSTAIDSSIDAGDRLKLPPARYGLREVDSRGIALTIADESLDGSKMLALHRTAPIGTVMKVTNTMSGKSTFAKVVGIFTENESTKDVIIVLTKSTADLIGALDKRFQVNLVYGIPNE